MKFEAVEALNIAVARVDDGTGALLASLVTFHHHDVADRGVG